MSDDLEPTESREPDEPVDRSEEDVATGRALAPMFTPGGRPGPGRPKGSLNRTTLAMREAVEAVFDDLQAEHEGHGRYPHFRAWAKDHPTEFYRIMARLMPVHVDSAGRGVGVVVFQGINDDL